MVVKKRAGTFDVYQVEMSFKELMAIKETGRDSGDPIADEISKGIDWYFANEVAPPGVDEHPSKAAEKGTGPGAPGTLGEPVDGAEADDILPAAGGEGGDLPPEGGDFEEPESQPAGPAEGAPRGAEDEAEELLPRA